MKHTFDCPQGVRVEWSRVNQAYLVLWGHGSVLRVINGVDDVRWYLNEVRAA